MTARPIQPLPARAWAGGRAGIVPLDGPRQKLANFFVARLREILIPQPDGPEGIGCLGADCLVRLALEFGAGFRGADRNGDDQLRWILLANRLRAGPHRRSGCQAVVDEDDNLSGEGPWRSI